MDPITVIGAVASVVQLAQAALSLSKTLYSLGEALTSAKEDIQALADDLKTFSQSLALLSRLLEDSKSWYSDDVYLLTARIIRDCAELYVKIDNILAKLGGNGKSTWKLRVKFVYKEGQIRKLMKRLRDMKGTLATILMSLQVDLQLSLLNISSSSKIQREPGRPLQPDTIQTLADAQTAALQAGFLSRNTIRSEHIIQYSEKGVKVMETQHEEVSRTSIAGDHFARMEWTPNSQPEERLPVLSRGPIQYNSGLPSIETHSTNSTTTTATDLFQPMNLVAQHQIPQNRVKVEPSGFKCTETKSLKSASSVESFQSAVSEQHSLHDKESQNKIEHHVESVRSVLHAFKTTMDVFSNIVEKRLLMKKQDLCTIVKHLERSLADGEKAFKDMHDRHYKMHGLQYITAFTDSHHTALQKVSSTLLKDIVMPLHMYSADHVTINQENLQALYICSEDCQNQARYIIGKVASTLRESHPVINICSSPTTSTASELSLIGYIFKRFNNSFHELFNSPEQEVVIKPHQIDADVLKVESTPSPCEPAYSTSSSSRSHQIEYSSQHHQPTKPQTQNSEQLDREQADNLPGNLRSVGQNKAEHSRLARSQGTPMNPNNSEFRLSPHAATFFPSSSSISLSEDEHSDNDSMSMDLGLIGGGYETQMSYGQELGGTTTGHGIEQDYISRPSQQQVYILEEDHNLQTQMQFTQTQQHQLERQKSTPQTFRLWPSTSGTSELGSSLKNTYNPASHHQQLGIKAQEVGQMAVPMSGSQHTKVQQIDPPGWAGQQAVQQQRSLSMGTLETPLMTPSLNTNGELEESAIRRPETSKFLGHSAPSSIREGRDIRYRRPVYSQSGISDQAPAVAISYSRGDNNENEGSTSILDPPAEIDCVSEPGIVGPENCRLEEPLDNINSKQADRILKRRKARQQLEEELSSKRQNACLDVPNYFEACRFSTKREVLMVECDLGESDDQKKNQTMEVDWNEIVSIDRLGMAGPFKILWWHAYMFLKSSEPTNFELLRSGISKYYRGFPSNISDHDLSKRATDLVKGIDSKAYSDKPELSPVIICRNNIVELVTTIASRLGLEMPVMAWACVGVLLAEYEQLLENPGSALSTAGVEDILKSFQQLQVLVGLLARYAVMENLYRQSPSLTLTSDYRNRLHDLCITIFQYFGSAFMVVGAVGKEDWRVPVVLDRQRECESLINEIREKDKFCQQIRVIFEANDDESESEDTEVEDVSDGS